MARLGDIVRSLLFYFVFYGGTVFCVLVAFGALAFGREATMRACEGWAAWHRLCLGILRIRVRIDGELPTGEVLVALKHESFLEAIDLPVLLDRPAIFAKAGLLQIPVWGMLGRAYGLIPVERGKGASALRAMIGAAREAQAQGRMLAIFPEGTRVPRGSKGELQAGFAALYKLLDRPVVPIALDSGPLYHRWWKSKGTMTYMVGEQIPAGLGREEIEARVIQAINAFVTAKDAS